MPVIRYLNLICRKLDKNCRYINNGTICWYSSEGRTQHSILPYPASEKGILINKHIELYSAKHWASQLNTTEGWILNNHKINVWEKQTPEGKGRVVGKLIPGSRALIIQEGPDDYKIKSPLDNSVGWVNNVQVKSTLMQDAKTFEPCR